nr:unnamed protein product [Timema genevievae]
MLQNVRQEVGFSNLTPRSQQLLLLERSKWQQFVSQHRDYPLKRQTVATCMTTLKKSMSEDYAVSCLVVGTESGEIFMLDPEAFTILETMSLCGSGTDSSPLVPAQVAATGLYDVEYRVVTACRDGSVCLVRRGWKEAKVLAQLSAQVVDMIVQSDNASIVLATMDHSLHCYSKKIQQLCLLHVFQGKKQWEVKLAAPVSTLTPLALPHVGTTLVCVALLGGAVHFYSGRQLCDVITAPDTVSAMLFGRFGQEEHSLILVTVGESLTLVTVGESLTLVTVGESLTLVTVGESLTLVTVGESLTLVTVGESLTLVTVGESLTLVTVGESLTLVTVGESLTLVTVGESLTLVTVGESLTLVTVGESLTLVTVGESLTLVTVACVPAGGALLVKILKRTAHFVPQSSGPGLVPVQHIKMIIPKKTKLFVEQTMRERENTSSIVYMTHFTLLLLDRENCCHYLRVIMHQTFQQDLLRLRLSTARSCVKALQSCSNPISGSSDEPVKISAQVLGLGPTFQIHLTLQNMSDNNRPSKDLAIVFHCDDKLYNIEKPYIRVGILTYVFECDDKLYNIEKPYIRVPMLVPGLLYNFMTQVEYVSDVDVSDQVRILVVRQNSTQPLLAAAINMPYGLLEPSGGAHWLHIFVGDWSKPLLYHWTDCMTLLGFTWAGESSLEQLLTLLYHWTYCVTLFGLTWDGESSLEQLLTLLYHWTYCVTLLGFTWAGESSLEQLLTIEQVYLWPSSHRWTVLVQRWTHGLATDRKEGYYPRNKTLLTRVTQFM